MSCKYIYFCACVCVVVVVYAYQTFGCVRVYLWSRGGGADTEAHNTHSRTQGGKLVHRTKTHRPGRRRSACACVHAAPPHRATAVSVVSNTKRTDATTAAVTAAAVAITRRRPAWLVVRGRCRNVGNLDRKIVVVCALPVECN